MADDWSLLMDEAVSALTAGDTVRAKDLFDRLGKAAGSYRGDAGKSLSSAWEPFIYLLVRRGYFVGCLEETRASLDEILAMGAGFDLYDLAASLSRCDTVLAAHLRAPSSRVFPELKPFSPNGGKDFRSDS
jgi:hypothetical protein